MLSFMHAQHSLFQQGYNLLDELDPYMKKLAAEVSEDALFSAPAERILLECSKILCAQLKMCLQSVKCGKHFLKKSLLFAQVFVAHTLV